MTNELKCSGEKNSQIPYSILETFLGDSEVPKGSTRKHAYNNQQPGETYIQATE